MGSHPRLLRFSPFGAVDCVLNSHASSPARFSTSLEDLAGTGHRRPALTPARSQGERGTMRLSTTVRDRIPIRTAHSCFHKRRQTPRDVNVYGSENRASMKRQYVCSISALMVPRTHVPNMGTLLYIFHRESDCEANVARILGEVSRVRATVEVVAQRSIGRTLAITSGYQECLSVGEFSSGQSSRVQYQRKQVSIDRPDQL